jgi:hypothetical protein
LVGCPHRLNVGGKENSRLAILCWGLSPIVMGDCQRFVAVRRANDWAVESRALKAEREFGPRFRRCLRWDCWLTLSGPPPVFSDLRITKDFKCFVFGSADSEGVMGAFFGSADCKGVRGIKAKPLDTCVGCRVGPHPSRLRVKKCCAPTTENVFAVRDWLCFGI